MDQLAVGLTPCHSRLMRTWLLIVFVFTPMAAYWLSTIVAARHLPRQRHKLGDVRPVPDPFGPGTSYRWLGIILTEKTSGFSRSAKRAFWIARLSILLIPIGFILTAVLAGSELGSTSETPSNGSVAPSVTLYPDTVR